MGVGVRGFVRGVVEGFAPDSGTSQRLSGTRGRGVRARGGGGGGGGRGGARLSFDFFWPRIVTFGRECGQ